MPTTLLAVDDSVTMRKVLELTFAGEDFRVVTAESADAAIAKIRAERPTVVLCDVTLDAPGGYALCTKIKADHPTVAVVMLASKQQPYDTAKGQAAKADDFVEKPFDTQQLIDKVKRLAARPATQDAQARPAGPPAPLPVASGAGIPPARPAAASAPSAPVGAGGSRPSVPGTGAPVNPRPPAPNLSAAGGIGRGTLAYGGAGFPGMPGTPPAASAPAPAPAASAPAPSPSAPGTPGRAPLPSAPSAAQTTPGQQAPAPPPPAAATLARSSAPQAGAPEGAPASLGVAPASATAAPAHAAVAPLAPTDAALARAGAPGGGASAGAPRPSSAGPEMAAMAANGPLADKLATLGLTDAQVTAVLALSREVVERVVWEVVPVLAETLIKEEIARLTQNA